MDKKVTVLTGGPQSSLPRHLDWNTFEGPFIGVDHGALQLIEQGVRPAYSVGDFDSVSSSELSKIRANSDNTVIVAPEKDETDTELGIQYACEKFPKLGIDVYGFSGGRLDQLLINLLMVFKPTIHPALDKLTLLDKQNTVTFFNPGKYQINKIKGMKYLTFVPLMPTKLTLPDEKYRLDDFNVVYPTSFSSNEFVGNTASFSFDKGIVMVIQSRD